MKPQTVEKIKELIGSVVRDNGLELFEIKIHDQKGGPQIDVFTDRLSGGITIDECTLVNRKINEEFEQAEWLAENYSLCVSSPGLDWPLHRKKDFVRVMSQKAKVFLKEPLDGKSEYEGVLDRIEGEKLVVSYVERIKEGKKRRN